MMDQIIAEFVKESEMRWQEKVSRLENQIQQLSSELNESRAQLRNFEGLIEQMSKLKSQVCEIVQLLQLEYQHSLFYLGSSDCRRAPDNS